eukprot:1978569-Amphidinium_carterae.1
MAPIYGSVQKRRIGMSSLKAACGAALLESTVQLMSAMSNQLPFLEHSLDGSANFKTMAPATAVLAAEAIMIRKSFKAVFFGSGFRQMSLLFRVAIGTSLVTVTNNNSFTSQRLELKVVNVGWTAHILYCKPELHDKDSKVCETKTDPDEQI